MEAEPVLQERMEVDQLDLLTFTRIMKVFAVNPTGVEEDWLDIIYESINQADLPYSEANCIRILVDNGYVRRQLVQDKVTLVPMERTVKIVDKLLKQVVSASEACWDRPSIKKVASRSKKIPLLTIPEEVRNTLACSVIVQDICNPRCISFQLLGEEHSVQLDKLMAKLKDFYSSDPDREELAVSALEDIDTRDMIAAPYEHDGHHRAMVVRKMEPMLQVMYIDYGNSETIPFKELYYLKDEFKDLPGQAVVGSVVSLKKVKGKLNAEAMAAFRRVKKVRAQFKNKFKPEDIYWPAEPVELEIIDEETLKDLKSLVGRFI